VSLGVSFCVLSHESLALCTDFGHAFLLLRLAFNRSVGGCRNGTRWDGDAKWCSCWCACCICWLISFSVISQFACASMPCARWLHACHALRKSFHMVAVAFVSHANRLVPLVVLTVEQHRPTMSPHFLLSLPLENLPHPVSVCCSKASCMCLCCAGWHVNPIGGHAAVGAHGSSSSSHVVSPHGMAIDCTVRQQQLSVFCGGAVPKPV